jgi:predicted kinase
MKKFSQLLEENQKKLTMLFGRMNPPTKGHEENVEGLKQTAEKEKSDHLVIASHSQDAKKNPLSPDTKLKHLKRAFPGTNIITSSKEKPTIMHHASDAHAKGYTHLHVIAGADRVDEYRRLLNHYNGKTHDEAGRPFKHGSYNFKKITVSSSGERTKGVSGTDMRNHAQNNDYKSFKSNLSSHMQKNDKHAKELFHDVRKGMGLNENVSRGMFKAIFITGGPGSGKDIVIREGVAEQKAVELSTIQAFEHLMDKKKLSEQSKDFRREAIRTRSPLIINGTADNFDNIAMIKEELEELGYITMMVYVDTLNEVSRQRNLGLKRMISESVREEKWVKAQENKVKFYHMFNDFNLFENNDNLDIVEESISDVYDHINEFLDKDSLNEISTDWLMRNKKLNINEKVSLLFKEQQNDSMDSKSIQKANIRAKGCGKHGRLLFDNNCPSCQITRKAGRQDDVRDGDVASNSSYIFRTYVEGSDPTLKVSPPPKESNFSKDKEKVKKKGLVDSPTQNQRLRNVAGIGPEYDTRQQGTVYPMSGLGDVTYREDVEPSHDKYMKEGTAAGLRKSFNKFRTQKEAIDDPGAVDMGVAGVLMGASNKEPMQTYKDQDKTVGLLIKKNKKQKQEK